MYVFGGYNGGNLNDLWVYDPQTDSWSQLASGATVRYGHTAVTIGGKMYVFGGSGGGRLNDLWCIE
jgi:N-acetylneuraminic acid mutarotase